jgi:hyaluronan synthase
LTLKQIPKYREMDRKRWLVRYLILAAVAGILAAKIYLVLFLIDIVVGLYSFVTTFVLFSILLVSFTRFKDPYYDEATMASFSKIKQNPLVSIIVPVKNEEGNIRNCIQSCLDSTYPNKEVIVVNDGSTDGTAEIIDAMREESKILKVMHLPRNIGKKKAIEAATEIGRGEIYVFMDSDITMAKDAVEKTVSIMTADNKIGALTAHGRVRDADCGALLKLQDVWYDGQYRIIKGMESSFSSLTCCSGSYTAFRKAAIQPYVHSWAHDKFLGIEFKFATDRRLTAYVLGEKLRKRNQEFEQEKLSAGAPIKSSFASAAPLNIPILQTGCDDIESMKQMPDLDADNDEPKFQWKLKYSPSIRVFIGPPETFSDLIKQQIRWRKSFIRSIFATGSVYWQRPFFAALLYYLQLGLKVIRPFVVLHSLILLPLAGDYLTPMFYVLSVIFSGMIYGIDFRLRNPGSGLWLYRPLMTLLSTFVLTWLLIYAAITIKKTGWR